MRLEVTSNGIAYEEGLVLHDVAAEIVYLGSPRLKRVERAALELARVRLIRVPITD